ncbi:uncharacterized membrane protein HdeD (DUF308 family) [Polaromonas sp. CG_9.5]|nr:uncharacterized membrane protein HdeD (DUF308 family) [Polaromonas sp. CG_9.5]
MKFNTEDFAQQPLARLREEWGWIALRGLSALIFGVLALALPGVTLTLLVIVWGAYVLLDGVLALAAGLRMGDNGKPMWALIVVGLLGIGAGIATFFWPGLTAITLILIIGGWAIAIGLLQIVAAVRLRKHVHGEWGCTRCRACCPSFSVWPWWGGRGPVPLRWYG